MNYTNKLIVYADGSGEGKIAVLIGPRVLLKDIKVKSNNEAEYLAIYHALKGIGTKYIDLVVYSDSQLAIKQLNHEWAIEDNRLREIAMDIWNLVTENHWNVSFIWIPRKDNKAGKILGK